MNKTITSNIAGYVFHIDENAYDKLDAYLNTIRSYFADSQGKDEIIADIEARLAEMLQERMTDAKQVVSMDDVNHVIQIMGQPEAFLEDDAETADWGESKSSSSTLQPKRLFRDSEDQVGAGVLSGISHYIGLSDPIWLRLAFVISLFISFGTALIVYVVLYLIIPEATTTAEKLQMRGESVTVSNIEKRVNEELETVKGKWNELHGNNSAGKRVGNFIHRLFNLVVSLASGVIRLVGKFLGLIFLVSGLIGFASIVGTPFGLPTMISLGNDGAVSSFVVQDILENLVGGSGMMWWAYACFVLAWGIPLLGLAYLGGRLLFSYRAKIRGFGVSLVLLWIIGVVMSFAITSIVASDFSSQGTKTETVELSLNQDPNQVIDLRLNHELGDEEPTNEVDIFDINLVTSNNSTKLYGKPEFDINMAKTGGPKLVIKRLARAKHKEDATDRAEKINYGFLSNDTSILFNGYFELPDDELWRSQSVELELLLPVGYTIFLSEEMEQIIYDIDNVTNTYDGDMVGRRWIMTPNGLACVDCNGIVKPAEDLDDDLKQKQQQLEMEQQRLEEEMKRKQEELDKIEEEILNQEDVDAEEASASSSTQEILLKRVINATYEIGPNLYRTVQISYPG